MRLSKQISQHVYQVFFGGNWTDRNVKDSIADISFDQATHQIEGFNSIAKLVFHIHYYVKAQKRST